MFYFKKNMGFWPIRAREGSYQKLPIEMGLFKEQARGNYRCQTQQSDLLGNPCNFLQKFCNSTVKWLLLFLITQYKVSFRTTYEAKMVQGPKLSKKCHILHAGLFHVTSLYTVVIDDCFYYTVGSVSGQDEPNRALWLATRAELCCLLGTTRPCPAKNFPESQIINPLVTKFVGSRWLSIGLVFFGESTDLDSVSVHKYVKKELGQYPATLTSNLFNSHIYWPLAFVVALERVISCDILFRPQWTCKVRDSVTPAQEFWSMS